MRRAGLLLLLLLLPLPARAAPGEPERVTVLFPAGQCLGAGRIEVEVWERAPAGEHGPAGRWKPHPEHPRIAPGSCQREDPGILLNEIRVRCVDPSGASPPSDWRVGANVLGATPPAVCPPLSGASDRAPRAADR